MSYTEGTEVPSGQIIFLWEFQPCYIKQSDHRVFRAWHAFPTSNHATYTAVKEEWFGKTATGRLC